MSKPIAAIVETVVDIDTIRKLIHVEIVGEQDDVRSAERHETDAQRHSTAAVSARESARQRRLRIGKLLAKVRGTWPERGPKAKGWGDFLRGLGISEDSALRYMAEARGDLPQAPKAAGNVPDGAPVGERPATLLAMPAPPLAASSPDPDDTAHEPPPAAAPLEARRVTEDEVIALLAQLAPEARKRVALTLKTNVKGGSGETARGTWCTSAEWAEAVGPWDLDPFSNPRSHIVSTSRCMLEDGGNGLANPTLPGTHRLADGSVAVAQPTTRVWLQPPYELVDEAIAHYGHTRFCALLRWSPDVQTWFARLWPLVAVVCHPRGERMEFEPPPGLTSSGDMPFPHALYYADERDVTDAVRARCLVWRIDHALDAQPNAAALHIVR